MPIGSARARQAEGTDCGTVWGQKYLQNGPDYMGDERCGPCGGQVMEMLLLLPAEDPHGDYGPDGNNNYE